MRTPNRRIARIGRLLLALGCLALVPASTASAKKPPKKPQVLKTPIKVPKFHGLLIPWGGAAGPAAPGGAGKIVTYRYARAKAGVEARLRELLKAGKWSVDKDTKSPRGTVRVEVSRKGHTVKLSVMGRDAQTMLVLSRK